MWSRTVVLLTGLVVACGGVPGTLEDGDRRRLYERADELFESGVLWKPSPVSGDSSDPDLAPLLIRELDSRVNTRTEQVVYAHAGIVELQGREYDRRTYLWTVGPSSRAQGIRATLGSDGFPTLYEVLTDASGARLIFVAQALEEAAIGQFGDPLAGRRFTIERAVEEAPDVVVAGTLEPGPIPLGPFVYVTAPAGDVSSVICRCMESRVGAIVESLEYELVPIDELSASGLALPAWLGEDPTRSLRWPAGGS